tara:strand:- start:4048 stop:5277 length:1230 start_codon:yes stop_codon:yes gene_type:complete
VIGYDLDEKRIAELKQYNDRYQEIPESLLKSNEVEFTTDPSKLINVDAMIVAVPTPVNPHNEPDLKPLEGACITIGNVLKDRGKHLDIPLIVFESTVYPGCTEEFCVPIIEKQSGLESEKDFIVGYSPERVNPGDTNHTLSSVVKIVSAQSYEACERVANLYLHVAKAGVHKAATIKIAEAAKVIENVQRDLNIALMNELALLFNELGIDTSAVLEAASTKWNFLNFQPGIVGGHCIPVDPYYLTYIAHQIGFNPQVILAGRQINNSMPESIAIQTAKLFALAQKNLHTCKVLILGATYKENVKDFRNTQVAELSSKLAEYGANVQVYDPLASPSDLIQLGLTPANHNVLSQKNVFDCLILAVPHKAFCKVTYQNYLELLNFKDSPGIVIDIKGVLDPEPRDDIIYWKL